MTPDEYNPNRLATGELELFIGDLVAIKGCSELGIHPVAWVDKDAGTAGVNNGFAVPAVKLFNICLVKRGTER